MRALASSLGAWRLIEEQEGTKKPHGLVFSLAVVESIGRPFGLSLVPDETAGEGVRCFEDVFISVLDSRCMLETAKHFRRWEIPMLRDDRGPTWPLVWAGGQGLHNPMPYYDVADVIVVGDAEDPLPRLIRARQRLSRGGFLAEAATIPGVFVPAHHDPSEVTIVQSVAADIGATLRDVISVSHDNTRRIEIARGCKYKCTFCSLGWRTPLRENSADDVIREIRRGPRRVHLQAGDAESHPGIHEIRAALREHGGYDQGWTGRLDTTMENPDTTVPGQKRYAFGVEGVSHRLRAAVGKAYLTDERLVEDTVRFFHRIEGEGKGRAAWHLIAGLPGQMPGEEVALVAVIDAVRQRYRGRARNLSFHWQPFQPLPGTPAQWCAGGGGARKLVARLRGIERHSTVRVRQLAGRTDDVALLCTVLARSGKDGWRLMDAVAEGLVSPGEAEELAGTTYRGIDPDAPLPWDFIETRMPRSTLRRAYDVMMSRLAKEPSDAR